ncbi:MAG: hypothetical protein HYR71_00205 [Chloroflexi bacterium]|nr:hypothetical protein [Chloroflexota bacterium]
MKATFVYKGVNLKGLNRGLAIVAAVVLGLIGIQFVRQTETTTAMFTASTRAPMDGQKRLFILNEMDYPSNTAETSNQNAQRLFDLNEALYPSSASAPSESAARQWLFILNEQLYPSEAVTAVKANPAQSHLWRIEQDLNTPEVIPLTRAGHPQ